VLVLTLRVTFGILVVGSLIRWGGGREEGSLSANNPYIPLQRFVVNPGRRRKWGGKGGVEKAGKGLPL